MGWTSTYKSKDESMLSFFKKGPFHWSPNSPYKYEILDTALVCLSEYYVAVKRTEKETGTSEVFALIFLIKLFKPDNWGHNISYKDMDETMGPRCTRCPERILDLLTPTDSVYANDWRIACRERIAARKARLKIVEGFKLKIGETVYIVMEKLGARGYRVKDRDTGCTYRINRIQAANAEVLM
jgi:hypothetical protein